MKTYFMFNKELETCDLYYVMNGKKYSFYY